MIRCGVDAIADEVCPHARAIIENIRNKLLVRIKKLPQELREEMWGLQRSPEGELVKARPSSEVGYLAM
jgi:hypothetical protein